MQNRVRHRERPDTEHPSSRNASRSNGRPTRAEESGAASALHGSTSTPPSAAVIRISRPATTRCRPPSCHTVARSEPKLRSASSRARSRRARRSAGASRRSTLTAVAGASRSESPLRSRGEHEHRVAPAERNHPGGTAVSGDLFREQHRARSGGRARSRARRGARPRLQPGARPGRARAWRSAAGCRRTSSSSSCRRTPPSREAELTLDRLDRRAHPRATRDRRPQKPGQTQQRAVDAGAPARSTLRPRRE